MSGVRGFLFKVYRKLTFGEFSIGEINVESDLEFLESLRKNAVLGTGDSTEGLLRSFLQFQCQMRRLGMIRAFILNLLALPVVILLFILFILRSFGRSQSGSETPSGKAFLWPGVRRDLLPASLTREYSIVSGAVGLGGSRETLVFLLKAISKYPLSFYFLLKVAARSAQYDFILKKYQVDAIISTSEYSFSSSAMTCFLSGLGKKQINVMHGEKLLFIRDAFVQYDRFFVWDTHYQDLFRRMNASPEQFVVELPPSLLRNREEALSAKSETRERKRLVYYLANESSDDLKRMAEVGHRLASERKIDFVVRLHPRYSEEKTVRLYFQEPEIEHGFSLDESLANADFVCSIYSTVLFEAHLRSKTVVIDDLTSPDKFEALKKLDYIMMSKPHLLLSGLF